MPYMLVTDTNGNADHTTNYIALEQAEKLIKLGIRTAVREMQEWIDHHPAASDKALRAYLYAMLITADGFEDETDTDGEG